MKCIKVDCDLTKESLGIIYQNTVNWLNRIVNLKEVPRFDGGKTFWGVNLCVKQ